MVKVRVGPDWKADLETLAELRALLAGPVEVMVDGSEIFTLPTALRIAAAMHDLGVAWFEEPLPHGEHDGIEELARRSPVPIAYGEHLFGRHDALDALRRHGAMVLQPDASTCGGILEARRMAQVAAFHGARVVPHVCAGPVSLAANLHVAASVPAIRAIEYPPSLAAAWEALGTGAALGPDTVVDGELAVPAGPGLGVGLAEEVAAAHPYRVPHRLTGVRERTGEAGEARRGFPDRFVGDR